MIRKLLAAMLLLALLGPSLANETSKLEEFIHEGLTEQQQISKCIANGMLDEETCVAGTPLANEFVVCYLDVSIELKWREFLLGQERAFRRSLEINRMVRELGYDYESPRAKKAKAGGYLSDLKFDLERCKVKRALIRSDGVTPVPLEIVKAIVASWKEKIAAKEKDTNQ